MRETWEEAQAKPTNPTLYTVFDLPEISQVHVFYRCDVDANFAAGPESLDVALFDETNIPWQELAFPVITKTLECFFADRKRGEFGVYQEALTWGDKPRNLTPQPE